jgi:hypothetical protein
MDPADLDIYIDTGKENGSIGATVFKYCLHEQVPLGQEMLERTWTKRNTALNARVGEPEAILIAPVLNSSIVMEANHFLCCHAL